MNQVLEQILTTGQTTAGGQVVSLRHPEFPDRVSHVRPETGALLQRAVREVRPSVSLEVGLAYGVSTLYICDALAELGTPCTHIVMDPVQNGKWKGAGLDNVRAAGHGRFIEFHEAPSEFVLPRLLEQGRRIDFAFIDGLHRFDQAFVEFYYVNRLLKPGGIVLFDDAARRSVNRVIRHALKYPAYEVWGTDQPTPAPSLTTKLRRQVRSIPRADALLRPDVLDRDWDLGILGRCVGLRKVAEDTREIHWDRDF
jgi:predicted O-methyltransferase YrrM